MSHKNVPLEDSRFTRTICDPEMRNARDNEGSIREEKGKYPTCLSSKSGWESITTR